MSSTLAEFVPWVTVIGSAIGSILAVATLIFRRLGRQDEEIQKIREMLHEERRNRTIHETQFNMFWDYWKQEVPKVLMKPHTPEIDVYMKKMEEQNGALSDEDKRALVNIIQELLSAEYDVYNIDKEKSTYLALLARFRTELQMPEEISKINQKYDEELNELQRRYTEKKKRRLRFW
jgi:hypothetical protein